MSAGDARIAASGGRPVARGRWPLVRMGLGLLLMLAAAAIAGFIITGRDVGPRGSLTADTQPIDVIIDGQPLSIPANMIRFRSARHDGAADRIDLLLSWPGLGGFTEAHAADFEDEFADRAADLRLDHAAQRPARQRRPARRGL